MCLRFKSKKEKHLLFLFLSFCIVCVCSCNRSKTEIAVKPMRNFITDSIYVDFDSRNGAEDIFFDSDTTAYSFNTSSNSLVYYRKNNNIFKSFLTRMIPDSILLRRPAFVLVKQNRLLLFDDHSNLISVNFDSNSSAEVTVLDSFQPSEKGMTIFASSTTFTGHTFIGNSLWVTQAALVYATFSCKEGNYANSTLFRRYEFETDELNAVKTVDEVCYRPKNFCSFSEPFARYVMQPESGIISVVVDSEDSVFQYAFDSGELIKSVKMNNTYYSKSQAFDPSIHQKYMEDYRRRNFKYHGILFNKSNGHYLVPFIEPTATVKEYLNNPGSAVILDEDYKIINYMSFDSDSKTRNFAYYRGNVAIRTNKFDKINEDYEKYYILNF